MPIPYYPSWRYHREHAPRLVQSPDEWVALGPGWADNPGAFWDPPWPGAQFAPAPTPESEAPEEDDPQFVGPPVSAMTDPPRRKRGRPRKESYGG